MREGYDIAQVCLNGHPVNSSTQLLPEFSQNYCSTCGAMTITTCQKCNAPIRGTYHSPGIFTGHEHVAPNYCHGCGAAYPWTEGRVAAAQELAKDLENLSEIEHRELEAAIGDLARDTPMTQVSAGRFKKLVTKAGGGALDGFRSILIDVASEAAKKVIWP